LNKIALHNNRRYYLHDYLGYSKATTAGYYY